MIRALVLDYGGVLSTDQGPAEERELAAILGAEPGAFHHAYWMHRGDYDRGSLDAATYWTAVSDSLGVSRPAGRLDDLVGIDAAGWSHLNAATVAWAREMAERLPLALLSNMPREVKRALLPTIRGIAPWAATAFSCDVGVTKPNGAIYVACARMLGVQPSEAVMVDDRPENVVGARNAGMAAVLFSDAETLRDAIQVLLTPAPS